MIMIKCTSIVLKNKNLYTEIDNTSINYIKPLQPEHRFNIEIEIINSSKNQSKAEVRVLNSDGECVAMGHGQRPAPRSIRSRSGARQLDITKH